MPHIQWLLVVTIRPEYSSFECKSIKCVQVGHQSQFWNLWNFVHFSVSQEVVTAVERGLLPQFRTLSVTSTFIYEYVSVAARYCLDKLFGKRSANIQLRHLTESYSSLLTMSTETSDSYTSYLQVLRDVNSAVHLINTATEPTEDYFRSKYLLRLSCQQEAQDFIEQLFDLQKIRDIFLESLEFSEETQSDLTRLYIRSIIDISYQTGQSFLDGQPVDLQPLCKELLGWLDTFHDVPPIDLSFFKSIIEFGCKNLQCALNGQLLDLKSACPLLRDWIDDSPSVADQKRPLYKSVVKALESVLVGNKSNFLSASKDIHDWIDNLLPDCPASDRSLFEFMADVFCTTLNCFFAKPLNLRPVSSLLHECIDISSNEYIDPSEFLFGRRELKYVADGVLTFIECVFNRPFSLQPVCDVLHRSIDTTPGFSEIDKTLGKFVVCTFCKRFLRWQSISTSVDHSMHNRIVSPKLQKYLQEFSSAQLENWINSNLMQSFKHRLRKRGIRLYMRWLVPEKDKQILNWG